jgi:hypothetical protein
MQTVTLEINNSVFEKFMWFLDHFLKDEIRVLEQK